MAPVAQLQHYAIVRNSRGVIIMEVKKMGTKIEPSAPSETAQTEAKTIKPGPDGRIEYYEQSWRRKLDGVLALRDYAISNNFQITDDILEVLQEAEKEDIVRNDLPDIRLKVDKAIRDLTSITFPTTIDTLLFQTSNEGDLAIRRFRHSLSRVGLVALVIAMAGFALAKLDPTAIKTWGPAFTNLGLSLLAASLGLLGAVVYVIFNLIGEWTEKVISPEDPAKAYFRLLLGPVVGWVFFFAFAQEAFKGANPNSALLLVPFLAGFSTKLVVGIINQTIQAVQIALGLEDKTTRLLARRSKGKQN
jgi:hypothetical protein